MHVRFSQLNSEQQMKTSDIQTLKKQDEIIEKCTQRY